MPCLFALIALAIPRGLIIGLWFFSDWFNGIFESALWPILGFVFLPTTLLWYSAVHNWFGGHWGFWQVAGVVIALMIDTSPGHSARRKTKSDA